MNSFPNDVDSDVAAMFIAWDMATRAAGDETRDLSALLNLYETAFARITDLLDGYYEGGEEDDGDDEDESGIDTVTRLTPPPEQGAPPTEPSSTDTMVGGLGKKRPAEE